MHSVYNCPIVTSYSEVLRNNIDQIRQNESILYLNPFLPIYDKDRLSERLYEVLSPHFRTLTAQRVKKAVDAAWAEQEKFKVNLEGFKLIKACN